MNCANCGAPLVDVARAGVTNCRYCHSQQVVTGGEGLDGVILLGAPTDLDCPACGDQLVTAVVDDLPCRACPSCFGTTISHDDFGDLVARRRASYQGADQLASTMNLDALAHERECPICHDAMEVHPYYGPGNTIIDSCSVCHLVWLDAGELLAIERSPGRR
ncbi:MAG: zf-TFIIB domain-containing protein [Planctomycetaceae bacterium]